MRRRLLIAAVAVLMPQLWAQSSGTTPKLNPADYRAHTSEGEVRLGAECLYHSLPAARGSFFLQRYLVVEVAVYPPAGQKTDVAAGMFTLRVFGKKKQELRAENPESVAYNVDMGDWGRNTGLQVGAGPVVIGGSPRVSRFPGDPTGPQQRTPPVPAQTPGGVERAEPVTVSDAIRQTSLPEGATGGPVSGYLFFAYSGKLKSIESAELVLHGTEPVELRLF